MKRTPIKRQSKAAGHLKRQYSAQRIAYLNAHPFCQVTIAEKGLHEAELMARGTPHFHGMKFEGQFIPHASQIHHRNKRHGSRLTDERWWLAVCPDRHEFIELNKTWARHSGYLLDVSCDADGRTPGGIQALTTPELMQRKVRQ